MKFFRKDFLNKEYEVQLSRDRGCIELHSDGQLRYTIELRDILNFNYFKPKQFIGNDKYWLNLKTRKNGVLFFSTQFSDEEFIKDFVELVPYAQLEEIEGRSLKRHFLYYLLPLALLGTYFGYIEENKFNGLLVLGLFFFIFNSIAIYNEYAKFKKYKGIKQK